MCPYEKVWKLIVYTYIVPFDSLIGPLRVLPFRVRVTIKECSTFPKVPGLEPQMKLSFGVQGTNFIAPANWTTGHSLVWGPYSSLENQLLYFTASADETTGYSLAWRPFPSAEVQRAYSTAPAIWTDRIISQLSLTDQLLIKHAGLCDY